MEEKTLTRPKYEAPAQSDPKFYEECEAELSKLRAISKEGLSQKKGRLGFGWGKAWIAGHLVLGGLFLAAMYSKLLDITGTVGKLSPAVTPLLVVTLAVGVLSAVGLMQRKRYGLIAVYVYCVIGTIMITFSSIRLFGAHSNFVTGGLSIVKASGVISAIVVGAVISLSVLYAWYAYFRKRSDIFR